MRAMRTILALAFILASAPALAQQPEVYGGAHGVGLGVEQNLGGLTGATFSYDAGRFRVNALLGLVHYDRDPQGDVTQFGLGGRFLFKIHEMPGADFSLGGGLAIVQTEVGDFDDTSIHLEGVAQIRVFVVPNVALSGSFGVALLTADDGEVGDGPFGDGSGDSVLGLGGQLLAGFGAIYYFE